MKAAVKSLALAVAMLPNVGQAADAEKKLDEISITATREARATAGLGRRGGRDPRCRARSALRHRQ
mgnify:CR=1 FL=1